jgi:F-type H+-transporting ATPase subunit epsilon
VPLDVHVVTPEREVWAGEAHTVIARGVDGEVGILTGHAPMMVQLAIGPLRVQRDDGPEVAAVVDGGFMHVTSGGEGGVTRVDVLASDSVLAGDIDVEAARARLAELDRQLEQSEGLKDSQASSLRRQRERAQARLDLAG